MQLPKVLAIYLPQFHETENNNKWWGKGFTDWVSVKRANPLFNGHVQPHIPLNEDYYDLSDVKVMQRQTELAKDYGIDGFVFYHYYFDADHLELHRPAENYLRAKDIDFPYCFSWANESWVRTWSKIEGNVWGEKSEKTKDSGDAGVLALQKYGGMDEWKAHYDYLLPFFLDDRYIKINGKPIFIIYAPENIPCLSEMIRYWNNLAVQSGFSGIFAIGSNTDSCHECLDAIMFNEPTYCMSKMREKGHYSICNGVTCFDYKEYWKEVLGTLPFIGGQTMFSTTVGYDTTPRRGKNGECFINRSPDTFCEGLVQLIIKSIEYDSDYLFIDAWNEWGEGMHLEPDRENAFSFLLAVRRAKALVAKMDISKKEIASIPDYIAAELDNLKFSVSKLKAQNGLVNSWLALEQSGEIIFANYLRRIGITEVAIYGYSVLGRLLRAQLEKEGIKVSFVIDRFVGDNKEDISVYRVEEDFPSVDMIIITVYGSASIPETLKRKFFGKIITIWELFDISET